MIKIGPYEIIEQLGQGGTATVYRAYQPSIDRYVAVKVLHQSFANDESIVKRFTREARLVAKLEHPHILPLYDFDGMHDPPYLVMRYMATGTLKDVMEKTRLPIAVIVHIFKQVGAALDYAHRQSVVHRDIKPSNIMLDQDGNALVADFGIARYIDTKNAGTEITSYGMTVGTPGYMAPEQILTGEVDGRADVYSLGVVLFELLAGRRPFLAETATAVKLKHINAPIPSLIELNPELPYGLDEVITKALAKEPPARYDSVGDFVRHLSEVVAESSRATATAEYLMKRRAERIERTGEEAADSDATPPDQKALAEEEVVFPDLSEDGIATRKVASQKVDEYIEEVSRDAPVSAGFYSDPTISDQNIKAFQQEAAQLGAAVEDNLLSGPTLREEDFAVLRNAIDDGVPLEEPDVVPSGGIPELQNIPTAADEDLKPAMPVSSVVESPVGSFFGAETVREEDFAALKALKEALSGEIDLEAAAGVAGDELATKALGAAESPGAALSGATLREEDFAPVNAPADSAPAIGEVATQGGFSEEETLPGVDLAAGEQGELPEAPETIAEPLEDLQTIAVGRGEHDEATLPEEAYRQMHEVFAGESLADAPTISEDGWVGDEPAAEAESTVAPSALLRQSPVSPGEATPMPAEMPKVQEQIQFIPLLTAEQRTLLNQQQSSPPPSQPARGRGIMVGGIVAALLVIGVVGAFVLFGGGDDDSGGSASEADKTEEAGLLTATVEATEETAAPTPVVTEAVTETPTEATRNVTEEATLEATPELTKEVAAESTSAPTEEAIESTETVETPEATNTRRPSATSTSSPTDTPTRRPTATRTPTLTPSPTATPSSTPSPTPSPTVTPTSSSTPTPTATPTPEPAFENLTAVIDQIGASGSSSNFNCATFVEAYEFLVAQIEAENPDYTEARGLVDQVSDPVRVVYEEYCAEARDDRVRIPPSVFTQLRNAIRDF